MKLLILCMLLIPLLTIAQEIPQNDYESLTYKLYKEQKWDSLYTIGSGAIDAGYNYYYMQLRTGLAAFYLHNYARAAQYLEKARSLNHYDDYVRSLLYYSYLYTGRPLQATLLFEGLQTSEVDDLLKKHFQPSFYIETGPVITSDKKSTSKFIETDSLLFSEKYCEQSAYYFLAGWKQSISKRVSVNTAFAYLNFNKNRQINIRFVDSLSGDFNVLQLEYYLSPSVAFNRRFVFSPSLRLARVNVAEPINTKDSITLLYLGNPVSKKYTDYSLGGELTYAQHFWKATLGAWHLKINHLSSLQLSSSFMLTPLGNLNLYSVTTLSWKSERAKNPLIGTQTLGYKIFKQSWIELSATEGNIDNTVEHNAQLFNNQANQTPRRLAAMYLIELPKNIRLTIRYQYLQSKTSIYLIDTKNILHQQYYNYNKHIITGGIIWNVH